MKHPVYNKYTNERFRIHHGYDKRVLKSDLATIFPAESTTHKRNALIIHDFENSQPEIAILMRVFAGNIFR